MSTEQSFPKISIHEPPFPEFGTVDNITIEFGMNGTLYTYTGPLRDGELHKDGLLQAKYPGKIEDLSQKIE